MSPSLTFVNGSIRGRQGNSGALIDVASRFLPDGVRADEIELASYAGSVEELAERLRASEALLFVTGVYWSSWGSPLQRFLEVLSSYELTPCFVGKPAGVVVSVDSVGGIDVTQRLQGVLSLLGCLIPPLSSAVISRAAIGCAKPGAEDVFQLGDLRIIVENLLTAARLPRTRWNTWEITRTAPLLGPYQQSGPLFVGNELPRIEIDPPTVSAEPMLPPPGQAPVVSIATEENFL